MVAVSQKSCFEIFCFVLCILMGTFLVTDKN